ncbi:MAG: flagellar hook-basal body complex protein FliE [Chthonomonas sp.]|nr:flagellar hook-basal body complex protein FliE [Chthonomonas sp.]
MRIDNATANLKLSEHLAKKQEASTENFGEALMDALKEVNSSQLQSREKQEALMAGQPVDVDDLMISMERASVAMQLTMQVRNKVLEAYQEVMRTQI